MILLADGEKRIQVQIRDIKSSRDCSENMKTWYVHIKVHISAPSQRRLQGKKLTPEKAVSPGWVGWVNENPNRPSLPHR